MSTRTRHILGCVLLAAIATVALAISASAALADTITVDFETGPSIGSPITDEYVSRAFTFWTRSDPGFRPYRRVAGVATQSGTVAADIGPDHCYPAEVDDPLGCEFPVSATSARMTRTASSVTVYAGLFDTPNAPVGAKLTAYRANGTVAATSTAPIGIGITTKLTATSAAPDIARWDLEATGVGGVAAKLGFDDLTYEFPANSLPDISVSGPVDTSAVLQGHTTAVPVRVTRLNGSDGPVAFSVTGLPAGVTGSVVPDPLPDTDTNATLRLSASANAAQTPLEGATLTGDPEGNADVAPAPRSAPFSVRVASAFDLKTASTDPMRLPHCAPVDRTFELDRDRAFDGTVSLTVEDVPTGVTAEVLPDATVPPGGGFNVERTLRVSRTAHVPDQSALTVRAHAPGYPDRTLRVPIEDTLSRATASPGVVRTARRGSPGTTVRLDGTGFCPGTTVLVGNSNDQAATTVAPGGRSLTFSVPRTATSGPVTVISPAGLSYQTDNAITVRSFRGEEGFAFPNFHFGSLSLSELAETAGADELFIQINPCWPWGTCRVPTGIIDPIAQVEWPIFDAILHYGDGHCWGMNRAIQEFHARKESYDRFASGVHAPFDLPDASGPQNGLESYLDSRQATQLTAEALNARFERDSNLRKQVERTQSELDAGRYPGIVMLKGSSGHEVTAYDIEVQPDGSRKIFTYDSNRPLTDAESVAAQRHAVAETQENVITISPDQDHWEFTSQGGTVLSGGANDGNFYAVTLSDVPDNPTLPGLSDLDLIYDVIGSVDGAVEDSGSSAGARFEPLLADPNVSGTAAVVASRRGARSLSHTVRGVKSGRYTQLVAGPGFAGGVRDVAVDKGVVDRLSGTPSSGALKIASGRNRGLKLDVAVDHGGVHRAASVATEGSKGGSDTVALGRGRSLAYEHRGDTARMSFTLTSVAARGGPVGFRSQAITVRGGERVTVTPLSWSSLDRVRVVSKRPGARPTVRILRNRMAFAGRFSVGTPKLSHSRATVRTTISRVPEQAAGGVVLRLQKGRRTVARKAVAIAAPTVGSRGYGWKLPRRVRPGRYRLLATMVLAGGPQGAAGRKSVTRAATVRVGKR